MKLLVVEDEHELLEVIQQSLEKQNYLVETADTYAIALSKVISYEYDCIILDIMLPDGNGIHLLEELKRQEKTNSVLIISAKDSLEDKIEGLNKGADDYLVKPFHLAELNARVKSVVRRKSLKGSDILKIARLSLNLHERLVHIDGMELQLNRKEFDILSYLVINKNRLVNKGTMVEHVWGDHIDEADDFEFLYSQIKNLRRKLRESHSGIEIQAVYGVGYKLTAL